MDSPPSSFMSICSASPKNIYTQPEQPKISPLTNNIYNDNDSIYLLFSKSIAFAEIDLEYNEQIIDQHQQVTETESSFEEDFLISSNIIDSFRAKNEIKALVNLL